jgi:hypothetical protein
VGEGGKRVQEKVPDMVPVAVEPTSTAAAKCSHKPFLKKDGSRADCVCQWSPPKRKGEESVRAYETRIAEWRKLRDSVAKKRGVQLAK